MMNNTNKAQHNTVESVMPKRKLKRRRGRKVIEKSPELNIQQTEAHKFASTVLDTQTSEVSEIISPVPDIQPTEMPEFPFLVPDIQLKNLPELASPVLDTESTKTPEFTSPPLDTQPATTTITAPPEFIKRPTCEAVSEPEIPPSDEKGASSIKCPKRSKTETAFYNDVVKDAIKFELVDIALIDKAETAQELSEDICQYISHSCYNNLLQIISNGCENMRECNRTKFTSDDFFKGLNFYRL